MRKFERYIRLSEDCVDKVQKTLNDGALLRREELFDFYFKSQLVGKSSKMM